MKTKALSILMAIFLAFSVSTVSMAFAADVSSATTLLTASKKKTVKLSAKKATIYYKGTKTLKLLNNKKKIKWSSSNKKVATVSSKGKVTAKGLGTAKITAKVGNKKYTCKVTVKDRNVGTAIGFVTNGGGYFIKGESVAKVTIRPKKYDCAKAVVSIKDAAGDTVYTKTYKNLKKNTNYSFAWNATDNKAGELPSGSYRVSVKIGNTVSNSPYLAYKSVNDFAGGNGSASKPFEISSTDHFSRIVKYPKANFVQTADLDFGFEATGGFFTEDTPFEGVYDGADHVLSNAICEAPLFIATGESAQIKNVIINNWSVSAELGALLVRYNYGKITNTKVNGVATITSGSPSNAVVGLLATYNYGTITSSESSGKANATTTANISGASSYAGGLVAFNMENAKIIDCKTSAEVVASQTKQRFARAGGLASENYGIINNCEVSGTVEATGPYDGNRKGTICWYNSNQIINTVYTGSSDADFVRKNDGVIA